MTYRANYVMEILLCKKDKVNSLPSLALEMAFAFKRLYKMCGSEVISMEMPENVSRVRTRR